MSSVAPLRMPLTTLDNDAWDDLLSFIEERRVIPIVGPELLQVSTERGPRLLYDWLAEKLATRLNVDIAALPQPYTLNDVVCWFLAARGRREEAYVRVRSILKDAPFEPPEALADKPRRAQLLKEASALVARVPAEMSGLHSVRLWRERIDEELHASTAAPARGSVNRDAA